MDQWIAILLPSFAILARVTAFFGLCPVFSCSAVPMRARVTLALMVTVFLAMALPIRLASEGVHWAEAVMLIGREVLCGAGLGLAVRLIYMGVQQGAQIIGRQMGMMMASIIDPTSGASTLPTSVLFDMSFIMLFLVAGGHRLLLELLAGSYEVFPVGGQIDLAALTDGVVTAGSAMLLLALKLSGPALAAFIILGVLLGIVARVLPEMNVLMASFPLRVALGLFIAAAIFPMLDGFTVEIAGWINRFLQL